MSHKKDSKELRMKLKSLNTRLTETVEKLRLKAATTAKPVDPVEKEEVMRRQSENAD